VTTPAEFPVSRGSVYALMGTVAVAAVLARVLSVQLLYEPSLHRPEPIRAAEVAVVPLAAAGPLDGGVLAALSAEGIRRQSRAWPATAPQPMPTFSSNDRSRWAAARALVDEGTFAIGRRVEDSSSPTGYRDEGITTEDGWQSVDRVLHPERQEFYSSKPPLLTVVVAGESWLLKRLFGWSLVDDRWQVVRTVLVTLNVLPFAAFLALFAGLLDRYARTDWARLYLFAAAAFGTFLTTFAVSLNNHTPAACCALAALSAVLSTPAAGQGWRPGLVSLSRIASAGFFAGLAFTLELPAASLVAGLGGFLLLRRPLATLFVFVPAAAVPVGALVLTNYLALGEWTPAYEKFGSEWYRYPGAHWGGWGASLRLGIDFIDEPLPVYAFHWLFGHHGIFSLTPVWLLSAGGLLGGLGAALVGRGREGGLPAWFLLLALALSVVVPAFYIVVLTHSHNYGGWTSGPRWVFWLTPVWLLAAIPAGDAIGRWRFGRWVAYLLLAVSVFSAAYPGPNPWRHPWLMQLGQWQGWVRY
jgi:hypothetical protein